MDINGRKSNLKQLSRRYKIKYRTMQERYQNGDRGEYLIRRSKLFPVTYVPMDNHVYTLSELAHHYGFLPPTIKYRFKHGSRGKALVIPFNSNDIIHLDNKKYTTGDLAKMYNLSTNIIKNRYYKGKRGQELIAPSRQQHNRVFHVVRGKTYTFKGLSQAFNVPITTLYNRYYHYELRNTDLVDPQLFNFHFKINGIPYNLFQLRKRYHIPLKKLFHELKDKYQRGIRGNDLIKPFEEQHGSIAFHGKRYTGQELASKYHLPYNTIINRYYNHHFHGDDLIKPETNNRLRQLSLDETNYDSLKNNHDYQRYTPTGNLPIKDTNRRISSHDNENNECELQGTITRRPSYSRMNDDLQVITFPLFTIDSTSNNDKNGKIVDCVAFNDIAQKLQCSIHKPHAYVALSGKLHKHERSRNDRTELIINRYDVLDDENMFN